MLFVNSEYAGLLVDIAGVVIVLAILGLGFFSSYKDQKRETLKRRGTKNCSCSDPEGHHT